MPIKVRQACRTDIDSICQLLREFANESPMPILREHQNEAYVRQLVTSLIMGRGIILVTHDDQSVTGLLMAIRQGSIWNPDVVVMSELAWFVSNEHRFGRSGYLLVKEYINICRQEVTDKKINTFTLTKMVNSPDIDYTKFGFNKLEEDYIWPEV